MTELAHERLRDGASPAEAWRAARAAARSNSATRDPYYWGLVRVVGSPSSVAFPASIVEARSASSRAWLWIGGAVALGVLAAMVVSRRRRALPRLPAG
jgi:hypothetical protein